MACGWTLDGGEGTFLPRPLSRLLEANRPPWDIPHSATFVRDFD